MGQTYHYILYTRMGRVETCTRKSSVIKCVPIKWKTKKPHCQDNSKYQISLKEAKSIPLTHKYMTAHIPPPLLFSIYLNDLQDFLEGLIIKGIDLISRDIENELMVYF
jgi:hypothetical protein